MIFLEPFLTFFCSAAEFAILGWWISLLFLAGVRSWGGCSNDLGKGTSGGRVQTMGLSVRIGNESP